MQWSREGVQPILQIRGASASNDWQLNWEKYILGAYQKAGDRSTNCVKVIFHPFRKSLLGKKISS